MHTLSTTVKALLLLVWLVVGTTCTGAATSQTTASAQSTEPSRLAAGPATPPVPAGGPPTDPLLGLDTGMHTAEIWRIGIDAANRYLVTGSEDKTVRVWELASGRLLRTLRPPIGVGNEGKIFRVALSPDGTTVAAGGLTGRAWDASYPSYLFDRESGSWMDWSGSNGRPRAKTWQRSFWPDTALTIATATTISCRWMLILNA